MIDSIPCVKRCYTLSFHFCLEGILVNSLALSVLHLVAVLAEAGHLLDHAHCLILDLAAAAMFLISSLLGSLPTLNKVFICHPLFILAFLLQ